MDGSKAAEMVTVGQRIVELGGQLDELRKKRDSLNVEISTLEAELRPLLVQHSKLMSELAGVPFGAPDPAMPAHVEQVVRKEGMTPTSVKDMRLANVTRKVMQAIGKLQEEGDPENAPTATRVAQMVDEDPAYVRSIMMSFAKKGPPMPDGATGEPSEFVFEEGDGKK